MLLTNVLRQSLLLLVLLLCASGTYSAKRKVRRSLSRRPVRSVANDGVNILFVKANSVEVGFNYVQGARRFLVSAREWVDGKYIGNEAFSTSLPDQARTATLRNLNPGREYAILVQAWGQTGKVGMQAKAVVRMSQQCYVCNGKPSNEDCQGVVSIKNCPHDKDACLNEVRYSKGVPKVLKRCAQWRPELGKQVQNGKDVTTACIGRENVKDAACKCMCRSNLCNEMEMPCINECFKELPIPEFSYLRCTDAEKIGSICRWYCMPGYKIQGRSTSECRNDRTWSVLNPPECVPGQVHSPIHICPTLEAPENSYMSCTNENNLGSTCKFACISQFMIKGSSERTCDPSTSKWSGEQPSCVEIRCNVIEENGDLSKECTNGENIGSDCEFECSANRKFVGKRTLSCLSTGRWSSTIPRCTAPDCAIEPTLFNNVSMECTSIPSRKTGRVCHFSCNEGYVRSGPKSSFCYSGNSWTSASPSCKRLQCRPTMYAPSNGFVRCSERNYFGSFCAFSCMKGYMIMGRESTRCGNQGKWSSQDVPTCKKIKCPIITKFNGLHSCSNGQNYGSICRFSCKRGFGFEEGAAAKVKCINKTAYEVEAAAKVALLGKWDSPIPKCVLVGCPKLGKAPEHASVKCSASPPTRQGTICTYRCAKGYGLVGSARTTCVARSDGSARGDWSSPPPACERITCEVLPDVNYGNLRCSDENYAGSECSVQCDYGRFVSGKETITCTLSGSWSNKLASCRLITCTGKPALKNGAYNCGESNRLSFNHECQASCNTGFEMLVPGVAVCGINGDWVISDELTCTDLNECEALDARGIRTNGGCEQGCVNDIGSHRCECSEDYELNKDGKSCRIVVCSSPEAIDNGRISCTNTNRLGSTCSLRCIPGFETRNVNKVTCKKNGAWDNKLGSCTRISCRNLDAPLHGFMQCSFGYKFGSFCDFDCRPGFELRGKSSVRCEADGKWTSQSPVCKRKICDDSLLSIGNAIIDCTDSVLFESECEVSCKEGYELEKSESGISIHTMKLECLEDSTWSRNKPECIKKRCVPRFEELTTTRMNGTVTCTDSDWLGSSCELSCGIGYEVDGNYKIKCIDDAVWSKKLGVCKKIKCPVIAHPSSGHMFCDEGASYQSKCSFYCREGYVLKGEAETKCLSDRTWTNKAPVCQRIVCTETFLKLLKGSVGCTEESFFGSVCEYRCDPGYEFIDTTIDIRKSSGAGLDGGLNFDITHLSCLATGVWGGEKPVCQRHECRPPSILLRQAEPNGNIKCSNGDKFESVCELSCKKGYEVVGGRSSTKCLEDRNWNPKIGQCSRVRCPMFEQLINGAIHCTNANFFESRCLFGCLPGYKLIGSPVSFCQADRTFTSKSPYCEKIECSTTHTKLEYGKATCTDGARFESECVYVCNPGYEMVFNGFLSGTEESVVLKCIETGDWDGQLPTCRRKQCSVHDGGIAKARLNGDVRCSELHWFQSVCTVECNPGFFLIGSATTRCTRNADWAPTIGYCERHLCPALEAPDHGSMKCTNGNKFESTCSFECEYGYDLIGFERSRCLAMEYFSSAAPICKEITCSTDFLQLTNAVVTCTNDNKLASRCQYECSDGYTLTSNSVDALECLGTYTWDGEKPECERKVCNQWDSSLVKAAESGTLTCTNDNKFQSICSVTCNSGYKVTEGNGFTECRADQDWGPELGYCTKITCKALEPIENGTFKCTNSFRYQSVCSFECDPGFQLTHNKTATCEADKTFSEDVPKCKKIICPDYHMRILNGRVNCTDGNKFGSICKYECNGGYERVTGSMSAQCLSDGTWDARKTGCERTVCDGSDILFVKAREHGVVSCTGHYYYESICTLQCNEGYVLNGLAVGTTQCNEFAKWDGELGYCTRKLCAEISAPMNGNMTCTNENRFQSDCTFTCQTGYQMHGESQTSCQADRNWTNKEPTCKKIECSADNLLLGNGWVNCTDDNKYLSVCWFGCDPGYEMEEEIVYAMCIFSKAWTRNQPTCVKKECNMKEEMITKALQNGAIFCTDRARYQSVCSLTCNDGYELFSGSRDIECTESATWDQKIGHCERITCEGLELPLNSKMECTDSNRFESVCTFACDEGYELDGASETKCLSNRTFSNPMPFCIKTKCSRDNLELPFGIANCTDGEFFMSVCMYQCLIGYGISGDSSIIVKSECMRDQRWSVEIPICEKKTCPYDAPHLLKAHEHGDVSCTEGNRYGSVCTVNCSLGYEVIGTDSTECTQMGTWTNPIGHCQKMQCETLSTPSAAIKSCTDEGYFNSSCILSCEGGYTFSNDDFLLEDEVTLTCLATRTWTVPATPPQCIKSSCSNDFLNLFNGNLSCSDGAYFGSQCMLNCNEGYELVQPADDFDVTTIILTCLANETWDASTQPSCRRVMCEPDTAKINQVMEHGSIKCTDGSNYESKCEISCHKGYEVVKGVNTVECLSDKSWSHFLGTCQKISCPPLKAPNDSSLMCSDEFRFKSFCKVVCRAGFEIYDPEKDYNEEIGLECKADGDWCGDVPTCARIKCSEDNLNLDGGYATCMNKNLFESECHYACHPGYQMTQGQHDAAVCSAHATWTNPKPTCEKRRCPANETSIKEAQVNGKVICTDENKFDSLCELHCAQGFQLTGEKFTTCRQDGEWSNGIGLCNKIRCGEIEVPDVAIMKCSDKNRYESFCNFVCQPGYMLTKESVKAGNGIVCQADGTWDGEIIRCEKISCPAEGYTRIESGNVTCNDENRYLSRCLFECDEGHELKVQVDPEDRSSVVVNCTERGLWDVSSPPKCVPLHCDATIEELKKEVENGNLRCSRESEFQSQCRLRCVNGYELVNGEWMTMCGNDRKWGPKLGTCQKISCQFIEAPTNGRMVCDDEFRYMSQCVFDCQPGYQMNVRGKKSGTTTCRADGNWIGQPPTCEKVQCDSSFLKVRYGRVHCSDKNFYTSECEFICDERHELEGASSKLAFCRENGTWSIEKPVCNVVTCQSAFAANGFMKCTGSEQDAVCSLTCEYGHMLNGSDSSTCTTTKSRKTKWVPPLGKCEKMKCPEVPVVANGFAQCSDGNRYRSLCFVKCNRGYKVKGVAFHTRCGGDGTWSGVFQTCDERASCDPDYLSVEYGAVTAEDGNNLGSTVTYICPAVGYKFTGSREVTCLDNGQWSRPKPKCKRITCPPINIPNGGVLCTGNRYNDYQSQCRYVCNSNYQRIGSQTSKCLLDGTWSDITPYCKGHCDIEFNSFKNGRVECTNSHYHHSRCRFSCNSQSSNELQYSLFGNDFLACKTNGRWDGTPPCCSHECIPNGKMDLFFVVHSSSRIRYNDWAKLLQFISQILDNFLIGDDNVLAGALRYNRDVDSQNEIAIGKYKIKSDLQRAIKFMNFGGWGTNTGKALEYIATKSRFQPGNRDDVTDVVILFVDDASQDEVNAATRKLRASNVMVYVIGIENTARNLDLSEMKSIASRPLQDHVAIIQGGFNRLSSIKLSKMIAKRLCKNPCMHNKEYLRMAGQYVNIEDDSTESANKSLFYV